LGRLVEGALTGHGGRGEGEGGGGGGEREGEGMKEGECQEIMNLRASGIGWMFDCSISISRDPADLALSSIP
jgi:hypothetical protein